MVAVSVFTPIYNRSKYLRTLYNCLCAQTSKDFEWIVVDDGSADDCDLAMEQILKNHDNSFEITYKKKVNGGKHTAINYGVKLSHGELFFILDSDDSLPSDSIEIVIEQFKTIANDKNICGVSGLMSHHNGALIGSGYPTDGFVACSLELRYKYGVMGDLIEVFRTNILREFPFPEIGGERFCPEALVWNRIATKYKLKCFNRVVYYRDYLDGGLTSNIIRIRMNSPIASMMCYSELCSYDIPFFPKAKAAINYWRFRFCKKDKSQTIRLGLKWTWVIPIAYLMHLNDCRIH